MRRRLPLYLAALAAVLLAAVGVTLKKRDEQRCSAFVPSEGLLVAHAGGGTPTGRYTNSLEALDLAALHGFDLVEIDFREEGGQLVISHDPSRPAVMTVNDLRDWLDRHPKVRVVTDIKTNNLRGLRMLADALGVSRVIPQIYQPNQFEPARAIGFPSIIFAERIGESRDWFPWVNTVDLFAVTLPVSKRSFAEKIHHRVFLYTLNEPTGEDAYTDCLVPADAMRRRRNKPQS